MDNSGLPATGNKKQITDNNGSAQPTAQSISTPSSSQLEPVAKPVPNRGGIPVEPVKPASAPAKPITPPSAPVKNGQSLSAQSPASVIEDSKKPVSSVQSAKPAPAPESASQPTGSSKNREQEPSKTPFPDVVKMTEAEAKKVEGEVEKEIEAMFENGKDKEKPDLSPDLKAIGVELAGEDIPMPNYPSGVQPLPMSFNDARVTRKKYKWKDSIAWLSDLIVYHWKKIKVITKIKP